MSSGGDSLDGQVVVVTGAAWAAGREIAQTLSTHGATVVSIDLQSSVETTALSDGDSEAAVAAIKQVFPS